jgi:choline dehydrogenase-like flavoprotein
MKHVPGVVYGPAPTRAELDRTYDACVVGSGASGSIIAWLLARAGLSVVIVEQGGHVGDGVTYDELLAAADPAWVRHENGTWGKIGYPWTTCNVGGGTLFYGGAFFRNRPVDFDPERALGRGEMQLRWPWDHDELDPYYTAVEELVGVSGLDDADPTLPSRRRGYPLPPVAMSPEGRLFAEGAAAMGWRPFPTPLAINSHGYRGREACIGDAPCSTRRCPNGAKADAWTRFLRPALQGSTTLLAGMKAVRLVTVGGRVVERLECVRIDSGERQHIRAARFFLCANAVQTAALLLRSGCERHPNGLGNASDLVGRGLCFKLSEYVLGFRRAPTIGSRGERLPQSETMGRGPFSTCAVTDLYEAPDAPGGLGGVLYEARSERTFGLRSGEQIVRIEALVPDEPQLANRVRLGPGTDDHGVADVVMDYQAHPRDRARLEFMIEQGARSLRAAGCSVIMREPSGWALGSCHLHGTCRMGTDPATSVTDPDGRLHDVDNVYVGDGAVLPFPSGANPTLTIQAVALRTARRMLATQLGLDVPPSTLLEESHASGPTPSGGRGLVGEREGVGDAR